MSKKKNAVKIALVLTGVILFLAALVMFLPWIIRTLGDVLWIFAPFLLSYFISILVEPMAKGLQKRFRLPRSASAVLVIILTVGIIGGVAAGVVWKMVEEAKGVYNDLPVIYEDIRSTWESISDSLSNIMAALPGHVREIAEDLSDQTMTWLGDFFKDATIVRSAGNAAKKLPSIFISTIVFLISLYFMIADSEKVKAAVKKPFTQTFVNRLSDLKYEIKRYAGAYVKAQLSIMCIAFVILLIGLSVLGVKYALIIALATAIVDALPFFGSGTVLIPWAVVSFVTGGVSKGIGLLIVYLSVILMRQFVEPKLVGKNIGLHPILTLMSMYVGYRIFSLGGMILGPLTVMLIKSLYHAGLFDDLIKLVKFIFLKIRGEIINLKNSVENEGD